MGAVAVILLLSKVYYNENFGPTQAVFFPGDRVTLIIGESSDGEVNELVTPTVVALAADRKVASKPAYDEKDSFYGCLRYSPSKLHAPGFQPLTSAEVKGVERFVFFIGYPRSGHSFIGSVLDAHPNVIIAHEYMLIRECTEHLKLGENIFQDKVSLFNTLYKNSFAAANCGWRSNKTTSKGYNLDVHGQWQGSFDHLRIIGDKSGGLTSISVRDGQGMPCLKEMTDTLDIPITAVHVVRNPYDMIATAILYGMSSKGATVSELREKVQRPSLQNQMEQARSVFGLASAVVDIKALQGLSVVEIHSENFIRDPKTTLATLCSGLGVPCFQDYVEECYQKTYRKISRTRDKIEWDPTVLDYISKEMTKFPFFQGYTFNESYYTPVGNSN